MTWQIRELRDLAKTRRKVFYPHEYVAVRVPILSVGIDLMIVARRVVNRFLYSVLSKKGISIFRKSKNRCVYFLHVVPEAATLVIGREHGDQIDLVSKLRDVLDDNIHLFVKEHPVQDFGYRPVAFYLRLMLMGIHTLPVSLRIQRDFERSDIVATIFGSIVLETVELGNRVILCSSKSWYRFFDNVTLLEDLQTKSTKTEMLLRHSKPQRLDLYFGALVDAGVLIQSNNNDEVDAQLSQLLSS